MGKELVLDIELYLINNYEFYRPMQSLIKNYANKLKKGVFDFELAIKGIENVVSRYLRSKDFSRYYASDIKLTKEERLYLSGLLLDHYIEEIETKAQGN